MSETAALREVDDAVDPDEVLRYAKALIAAPSENPGGTEDEAAAVAGEILSSLDAAPQTIRSDTGRPSIVASFGAGSSPHLAWNGHLDVVPAGSPDTWTSGPWEGRVRGGRLVGRGAVDMKGAIAAALGAVAAIRRARVILAGRLDLHLVADEELAGIHGTKVLLNKGLLGQDACIVGEPSDLRLGLAERGGAWITATARGTAAHGSQPHLGVNAITSMARFLLRLPEALPDRTHPLVGGPTVNAALISGGSAPNVVPDRCRVDIDRRVIPGESDPDEVLAPFRRLIEDLRREYPEVDLDVEVREWCDAAEAEPDSSIAEAVRASVRAVREEPPIDVGFPGITDARYYLNDAGIPAVILGPGSLTVAHTANEWIDVAEMVAAARIYARTFVGFLGAE
jgi:succinyl-diaminopimelate desuccinylase